MTQEYTSFAYPDYANKHTAEYQRKHASDSTLVCPRCYVVCGIAPCGKCDLKYCSERCRTKHAVTHAEVCGVRAKVLGIKPIDIPLKSHVDDNKPTVITNTINDADIANGITKNKSFIKAMGAIHGRFASRGLGFGVVVISAQCVHPHRAFYYGTFVYIERSEKYSDAIPGRDSSIIVVEYNNHKYTRRADINPDDSEKMYRLMSVRGNLNQFKSGIPFGFVCDDADYMEFCDASEVQWRVNVVASEAI